MSSDIEKGRFLEVGQYKGHFYGTSYDSVNRVASRGKICLVDTSAEAINTMLKTDMHPVVIFLRPSSMKALADQLPHLPADRIGELYMQAEKVSALYGAWCWCEALGPGHETAPRGGGGGTQRAVLVLACLISGFLPPTTVPSWSSSTSMSSRRSFTAHRPSDRSSARWRPSAASHASRTGPACPASPCPSRRPSCRPLHWTCDPFARAHWCPFLFYSNFLMNARPWPAGPAGTTLIPRPPQCFALPRPMFEPPRPHLFLTPSPVLPLWVSSSFLFFYTHT